MQTLENFTKAIQSCNLLQQDLNAILQTASPAVCRIVELQLDKAMFIEAKLMEVLKVVSVAVSKQSTQSTLH